MRTTKIVFFILPELHLLDLAGADQVFYEAIEHGTAIEIVYCSLAMPVETSAGLPIAQLQHFEAVQTQAGDYIIVPGSNLKYLLSNALRAEKAAFQWIVKAYENKVNICSICSSAFFLGLTGLLDHKKCTTHWKRTTELQAHFPKAKVQENILFTEDNGVLTSAGVTSGIDLALHIVTQLRDEGIAYKVARELVIYSRRGGDEAQQSIYLSYRNHIHTGVHKIQDWLHANLDKGTSLLNLSEIACMSTRTMTRIFKKETGITIHEYVTLLRKERIKSLLKNPDLSRTQMAQQCGLKSERQLSRLILDEI
jgi:transcriptional regulator GlxA family with amidase domain